MTHLLIFITCFGTIKFETLGTYPSDKEEEAYYLNMPTDMAIDEKFIYIVDQNEHCILKIDLEGNFISRIGRQGQGPGEFSYPNSVATLGDNIIIYDNTRKFQILTKKGKYLSSFKVIEPVFDFEIFENNIYSLVINRVTGGSLTGHTLQGKRFFRKDLNFQSRYKNFYQNNKAKVHLTNQKVTLLQVYHPSLFTLENKKTPLKKLDFNFSPFSDETYLDTGYKYAFQDFVNLGKEILTFYPGLGGLNWCLFSVEGKLLERGFLEFYKKEMVSLVSAGLHNGNLFLLLNQPEKAIKVQKILQGRQ